MLLNKYEKNVDRTMGSFLFTLLLFSLVLDMWNCCFSESLAKPWEKRAFRIAFIVIILVLHCVTTVLWNKRTIFTITFPQAEAQKECRCLRTKTKTKTHGLKTR